MPSHRPREVRGFPAAKPQASSWQPRSNAAGSSPGVAGRPTVCRTDGFGQMTMDASADYLFTNSFLNEVLRKLPYVICGTGLSSQSFDFAMVFNLLHIDEPVAGVPVFLWLGSTMAARVDGG
jgi:hypothetical protein